MQELTITDEPVWSKDAGRGSDATMVGTVIAWKAKLQVKFPPMSDADAARLGTAVQRTFMDIRFHHPRTNTDVTKTMYAGTTTYPVYSYSDILGYARYTGITVDFIEK